MVSEESGTGLDYWLVSSLHLQPTVHSEKRGTLLFVLQHRNMIFYFPVSEILNEFSIQVCSSLSVHRGDIEDSETLEAGPGTSNTRMWNCVPSDYVHIICQGIFYMLSW